MEIKHPRLLRFKGRHKTFIVIIHNVRFLSPPVLHARWAHMHRILSVVCPSVCHLTKIHWTIINILKNITLRVLKFDHSMDVIDPYLGLKGQSHRSNVNVTRLKKNNFGSNFTFLCVMSLWSKVTWVKVKDDDPNMSKVKVFRLCGSSTICSQYKWQVSSHHILYEK